MKDFDDFLKHVHEEAVWERCRSFVESESEKDEDEFGTFARQPQRWALAFLREYHEWVNE